MSERDAARKYRAILFVGYHYLSTPMYTALRRQLRHFDLFYVFTKDTIASDTNFKYFDRESFRRDDPNYRELSYDPPWFRGLMPWHVRGRMQKVMLWLRWVWSFSRFKREVMRLVWDVKPDLIVTTSDLFFTPRYVASQMPDVPVALLQPCYLDLWERPRRFPILKRVVNLFQPQVFERQEYFGLEIERAKLMVWEPAAAKAYEFKGRETVRIISPSHLEIRANAESYRRRRAETLAELGFAANDRILAFFPAYYGDVKGHGRAYQQELERALVDAVRRVGTRFTTVIKIHPNEDMDYWRKVFASVEGGTVRLIHNIERFKLMAVSDVHVSTNSYAAVEATLSGTVAVNFVPGVGTIGEEFCAPFSRNAAVVCRTVAELEQAILRQNAGPDSFRDAVAAAQERILGERAGFPTAEDVFLEMLAQREGRGSAPTR